MGDLRDCARLDRRAESRHEGTGQGMNGLRYVPIVLCGLLALAGFLLSKLPASNDGSNPTALANPAVATVQAARTGVSLTDDGRRLEDSGAAITTEFPTGPDTTGLLQESLTIDGLLDEVNADSGDGVMPVDPGRLGAVLRSDAELRKAMAD